MGEYIGNVCPFCKTEIKEGEEVKVCPECGIPHHAACWKENKGCTTFGCKEQHYEEQHTNPMDVCAKCGAPLGDGQDFCPKCGTPKGGKRKNVCSKCGAELDDGQVFCPKCGQKADLQIDADVNSAINRFNAGVTKTNEVAKKKPIKIAIIVAAVVVVAVLAIILVPKIFKSAEDYMALANYEKAYNIAKTEDDKAEVVAENAVAICSNICTESLKDSKSFDLRDAYYDPINGYVVLNVAANNSYGNTVLNYWLFTYDNEDEEFEVWDAYSDLDEEEYSKYDTSDELVEKMINNLGKGYISDTMKSNYKLSNDSVKRINALFADELLDGVSPLEVEYKTETEAESAAAESSN